MLRTVPGAGSRGFTLVELMIALVVIAVGILALSGVQTRSSRDVYSTGRQERALALAQERIEIARSAGYATVAADSGQTGVFAWRTGVNLAGRRAQAGRGHRHLAREPRPRVSAATLPP